MQSPVQAVPQPRYFMQLIVGLQWNPRATENEDDEPEAGRRKGKRGLRNPSLLQLTTFAIGPIRR